MRPSRPGTGIAPAGTVVGVLWRWIVAFVAGYLLGSVPVADVVCRRVGLAIRDVGDRNPGYWNVKEQLGGRAALPVLLGDTAKGAAAGLVGVLLVDDGMWGIGWVAVAGAMVGHGWPLFAGFRGGKSLLAFVGGMLVLTPVPALVALAVLAVVSFLTTFSTGIKVALFSFPVIQLAFVPAEQVAATGLLMCIFVVRFAVARVGAPRVRAA